MADNFDTNVARRKPNTGKKKSVHPWDVPVPTPEQDMPEEPSHATYTPTEPAVSQERTSAHPKTAKSSDTINKELKRHHSDLSDSINIHSNYCKLDNNVSDHLCSQLSSSAQSVYLRLYRQSFGWNRNWAAESLPKLKTSCNLSLQTVRKAIKELENKGCIQKEFTDNHKATIYRVFLPSEIGIINNAPQIINTLISGSRETASCFSASVSVTDHDTDSQNHDASISDGIRIGMMI